MNRRGFLRGALGAAVGAIAGAELAEALAPKRTIFLPPRGGWFTPYDSSVYDIQTAIGAELDALLRAHGPVFYNDEGLQLITERVHAAIRKVGETDAQLRERVLSQTYSVGCPILIGMEVIGPGIPPGTRIVSRA